jgi:putative ABC transport system permease protein
MCWVRWVFKNLLRNRRRTLLTVPSVAASLFLVALLAAGYRFLNSPPAGDQSGLILAVSPRASMTMSMPLWYKDRIAALPGVGDVSPFDYMAAHYGGNDAVIPALALQAGTALEFFPSWKLPPEQQSAFVREKTGLLVGRSLAEKHSWRVGQRIQFSNSFFMNLSMPFVICGIYDSASGSDDTLFHWDYLNDAAGMKDRPYMFWVRARTASDVPRLTRAIDAMFRNAPVPTRTGTMKQFVLDWLNLLGNVKLMLLGVMGAVVFSVLLVVANAMAMTIRERTTEIAVLRALGFRRRQILELLTAEAIALAFAGAVVGSVAAKGVAVALSGIAVAGAVPARLAVDGSTFLLVTAVGLGIALASTLAPAYQASRTHLADALRFAG